MARYLSLLPFLLLVAAAAAFGTRFEPGAWHAALDKPAWHPPNAVFGPAWTFLYILIAIAGWRAWLQRHAPWARTALVFWAIQLILNALWSWLFFGLHLPLLALAEITVLLAMIAGFILVSWRHDRLAAGLFVPYFAWVAFATALNAAIWWMNR